MSNQLSNDAKVVVNPVRLYHGNVFTFTGGREEDYHNYSYIPDGALVVNGGKIVETGSFESMRAKYNHCTVVDYGDKLIMPGFIDSHIHFPQTAIVGSYGKHLLDWLKNYTYPIEECFSSEEYCKRMAHLFLQELIRNGTTSCLAYTTVFPQSTDALFAEASAINMNMIAGKVLMDRGATDILREPYEIGERLTRNLIEKWHNKGRNRYAITPRFAVTSTQQQLDSAGNLHKAYPDTYIQTHLCETNNETNQVLQYFHDYTSYLEVYEKAGLITDRTVLGHCIHLSDNEIQRLSDNGSIIAHCPTSNLFLGSGLYDMERSNRLNVKSTLASDIGAGTSFSMFRTMGEAYKVQQLNNYSLSAMEAFYRCTKGTAIALRIENEIGSFNCGLFADFIVVDPTVTNLQVIRREYLEKFNRLSIENILFGLMSTGDERNIIHTYVQGNLV